MEDAATAEISRTQVWQWLQNESKLDDGRSITESLYQQLKKEELEKIEEYVGSGKYADGKFSVAVQLFDRLVLTDNYVEFLTLPAYELL